MANKSDINLLQEMTIKQGFIPEYTFREKRIGGTSIEFICTVICKELHADGTGKSKKEAKHNAAKSMISLLGTNNEVSPSVNASSPVVNIIPQSPEKVCETSPSCTQSTDNLNYIGMLQEFCQQQEISTRDITYKNIYVEELDNKEPFTVEVSIRSLYDRGTGQNKKAAKHEAARKMLLRLNPSKTDLNTTNLDSGKSNIVNNNRERLENDIRKLGTTISDCVIKETLSVEKLTEKAISRFFECKQYSGTNQEISSSVIKNLHTLFERNYSSKIPYDIREKMRNIKYTYIGDLYAIRRDIESSLKVKIQNFAVHSTSRNHKMCCIRMLTNPRITQFGIGETEEAAESAAMYNLVTAILTFLND